MSIVRLEAFKTIGVVPYLRTMRQPELPDWMDVYRAQQIAKLRAAGYSQRDIAEELGISQQTVSRYLKGINEAAESSGDRDFFIGLLILGALGVAFWAWLQGQQQGRR